MVMRDMLVELGFLVIGPFSRAADAAAAAASEPIDAAVLDINLDGELVYPVAEELARRDVPFIFVTGYGAESIERRFAHVPVLQKPIERPMLEGVFLVDGVGANGSALAHGEAYPHPPEPLEGRPMARAELR